MLKGWRDLKVFRDIPEFKDSRGTIFKLLPNGVAIRDVLVITSKEGSERASHYHKTDSHYCYLVKGSMIYCEKGLKKGARIRSVALTAGDMVYTPPKHKHWMRFTSGSIFIAMATKPRNQKNYENDTVRF